MTAGGRMGTKESIYKGLGEWSTEKQVGMKYGAAAMLKIKRSRGSVLQGISERSGVGFRRPDVWPLHGESS
ncbi:hypothetical protein K1719_001955 [Acacia pycnantha]|nr:hypothetical protein K1719_001955 [Acacia pycnantha]